MKKYFLGILAISAAFFLSAFTSKNHINPQKSYQLDYIWYNVESGETTTKLFGDNNAHPKDGAGGAKDLSGCPDDADQPPCVAGFSTDVGSGYTDIPTSDNQLVRMEE